jgi:hypothetical protein
VLSVHNKAEHRKQPNEGKTMLTQAADDWETEFWKENQNKVVPANEDAQESAQLKPRNQQRIVEETKWD